jgi:hypothetical protein
MYNFINFIPSTKKFLTFYLFLLKYTPIYRTDPQVNLSYVISLHVIDRLLKKASLITSSPYLAPPPFPLPLSASFTPSFNSLPLNSSFYSLCIRLFLAKIIIIPRLAGFQDKNPVRMSHKYNLSFLKTPRP